ncbi:magnesium transporter CorA family protein [Enterococcus italicus]|uniref:magnesium transporter CorA family protein n=1 Tax=Enterococcus italicus TaxID=246144 RepID=UPI002072A59F|nr:magnesium transporter CorA family protein [Enterococcus italicus]
MITRTPFRENCLWITIDSDRLADSSNVYEEYEIDPETLSYALDKNERAHTEYEFDTDTLTVIFNVLNQTKDDNHYETIPMTFVAKRDRLLTIYNHENAYIIERMKRYLARNPEISVYKFLFVSLFLISEAYFPYVEKMDRAKDEFNRKLREKTTKRNLLALSDIETGMVYLVSAANQNVILLEQLKGQFVYKTMDDVEREQLEDSIIEARQLSSMTQLNAQVLQQLSGTYNNILNNNLNDNMTTLTIISILLAMLAVITGFFGMNVPLPMTHNKHAWLIILGLSVLLWLVYGAALRYIIRKK